MPITATALAAADDRHAGTASGVNNAVARTAQLVAVAALPVVAGLSSSGIEDPQALADGFQTPMRITASLAAAGALVAFTTIRTDALESDGETPPERPLSHCAVAGTPLGRRADQPRARREPTLS